ncbi:MAG: hypothetical protein FWE16_05645 [Firmicutes bacterium]|nr:hypothetical protein [Bacillota bacterium]
MTTKKFYTFVTVLILATIVALGSFATLPTFRPMTAFASTWSGQSSLLTSYVMDDLQSATLVNSDGEGGFDIRNYQPQANAPIQLLHFAEYGFSFHPEHRGNFSLFVYFFNPGLFSIVPNSPQNTIQMAIGVDGDGLPNYEKVNLRFVNHSTGNVAHLFYKFILDLTPAQRTRLLNHLNTHERIYSISGAEFTLRPTFLTRDFNIGRTYIMTGFANRMGPTPTAPSTLSQRVEGLRTLELDVRSTWWRSMTSDRGTGYQHQINSVWFSVPNEVLEEFGRLQRIRAEWQEFQTQDMIVTSYRELHNRLMNVMGQRTTRNNSLHYGLYLNRRGGGSDLISADWSFNPRSSNLASRLNREEFLHYSFFVNQIERSDIGQMPMINVDSNTLERWIFEYDRSFHNGTIQASGRTISADLFTDTIDQHRLDAGYNRGHNIVDIDYGYEGLNFRNIDDVLRMNWWQRMTQGTPPSVLNTLSPIHEVVSEDFPTSNLPGMQEVLDRETSNRLFVNFYDLPHLRSSHQEAVRNNETLFLFRFARTDSFANWLEVRDYGLIFDSVYRDNTFLARHTIFLDFDIIHLDFYGEFGWYRIPVVSDPINIIPPITSPTIPPPPAFYIRWLELAWQWIFGNWRTILIVLVAIGLLVLLGFINTKLKLIGGGGK